MLGACPVLAVSGELAESLRVSVEVGVVFSAAEVRVIRDHYASAVGGKSKAKHKGKHKHKALPPGIAKNLARGKPLPPGIAKRGLPDVLILALPPVPEGYERIVVAGKILLIEIATQVVRDILTDVLFD